MRRFDNEMVLEKLGGTSELKKEIYTKDGPHYAPLTRPVMGASLMAQALAAAYQTIDSDFHIHHLTTQFFLPGKKDLPLRYEITRASDTRNNAVRLASIIQNGKRIALTTMSFIRPQLSNGPTVTYQPHLPNNVDEPEEDVNDTRYFVDGLLQTQALGRQFDPLAPEFGDNKTRHWLRIRGLSDEAGSRLHHCGVMFLSDHFVLDSPARLLNLQLGLGEGKVGKDQSDSPYGKKSTKDSTTDNKIGLKSDFKAMLTLNHTVHFHDPGAVKADEWLFMEASTPSASGGRVFIQGRLFARSGALVATTTQEGYYRLRPDYSSKI